MKLLRHVKRSKQKIRIRNGVLRQQLKVASLNKNNWLHQVEGERDRGMTDCPTKCILQTNGEGHPERPRKGWLEFTDRKRRY